jgi:hypothetical protein
VAADCLVLPSDHGETWGLLVNEALASGLPCLVSDACGCAEDLLGEEFSFPMGSPGALPANSNGFTRKGCTGHFDQCLRSMTASSQFEGPISKSGSDIEHVPTASKNGS